MCRKGQKRSRYKRVESVTVDPSERSGGLWGNPEETNAENPAGRGETLDQMSSLIFGNINSWKEDSP